MSTLARQTQLRNILNFVRSHNFAARIEGDAVMIDIEICRDSVIVDIETEQADGMSEAREILGY